MMVSREEILDWDTAHSGRLCGALDACLLIPGGPFTLKGIPVAFSRVMYCEQDPMYDKNRISFRLRSSGTCVQVDFNGDVFDCGIVEGDIFGSKVTGVCAAGGTPQTGFKYDEYIYSNVVKHALCDFVHTVLCAARKRVSDFRNAGGNPSEQYPCVRPISIDSAGHDAFKKLESSVSRLPGMDGYDYEFKRPMVEFSVGAGELPSIPGYEMSPGGVAGGLKPADTF